MSTATFEVTGMTCNHCAGTVKQAVQQIDGVESIEVDVAAGRLSVTSATPVDDAAVTAAVEQAGYEASRA